MSLTQAQLAKKIGLSRISVARALNGQGTVSEATRQRVLEAARELGYNQHSNHHARALIAKRYGRRLRYNAIAVLMMRDISLNMSELPFFTQLLDGIESQVNQYHRADDSVDIDLFLSSLFKPQMPRLFSEGCIDGAISISTVTRELALEYAQQSIPLISLVSVGEGVHSLVPDNVEGMRLAVKHLAHLGHQRIAYVGSPPSYATARERLAGYRQGLKQCGLPEHPELVEDTMDFLMNAHLAIERLLARTTDFTALICYNDTVAMHAVTMLQSAGLNVPGDVSVVGFDDTSVQQKFPLPITSVYFDRVAMGRRAVQWIYERADENEQEAPEAVTAAPQIEVFPVELAVRESTAPPYKRKLPHPK